MDFHLKQWRNQHESEEEQQHSSTKMPKLLLSESSHHHHQQPQSPAAADSSALPLFVPEPNCSTKLSTLSDSSPSNTRSLPRMGSYFSMAQWQELELQAMIFRYMLAGAAVPPELLQPIKKSFLHHSSPFFLHHPLLQQHYQPASLLQSGYWGRGSMDPEPGRCRRTDGKKWRCSRDVVVGQKYCERHVHRGRNRSRKPVELPTPIGAGGGGSGGGALGGSSSISSPPPLATGSVKSPFDLLHLNHRPSGTKEENKSVFENQDRHHHHHHHHHVSGGGDGSSGGHMLRHFFDDWPRSQPDNGESNAGRRMNSAASLSFSTSDVSLKLSTGYGEDPCPRNESGNGNVEEQEAEQLQLNWAGGWTTAGNQVASMGGPLAEALRSSSTSTSSPTSVLHQLHRGSASETSFIST